VKNYKLTKSVFMALLLSSAVAMAEDKYPASDFQPKVVYQDESVAKQTESTPASASRSSSSSSSSNDSQYPAANFEPKVLYSDENYKHNSSVPASSSFSAQGSNDTSASTGSVGSAVASPKEESSVGYLLGLVVFGIAGFVLYKRGVGVSGSPKSTVSTVARSAGGLTGVGRYILKSSGTGVTRYLEQQKKNAPSASAAATGVAKYLASQVSSAKSTASEAVTGVEKYMRNKG
jgi:hypothetical protein